MRVLEVTRKVMGVEFVDYPVLEMHRDWTDVVVVMQGGAQPTPPVDGLQMHGTLLCREGGLCVYSCGGLLTRSATHHGEDVWISVTPSPSPPCGAA